VYEVRFTEITLLKRFQAPSAKLAHTAARDLDGTTVAEVRLSLASATATRSFNRGRGNLTRDAHGSDR